MELIDRDLVERYGAPVPRYTSYPTAPHFHAGVTAADYREWLGAIGEGATLSLYLHVPFCDSMCWYCGCHTKVVKQYRPIGDYAALLRREIELVADAIPGQPPVTHIHWGGGTPSMLSPADFALLMEAIRGHFAVADQAEVAVELDPRTLGPDKVEMLARAGVTRASLGVQDFSEAVQAAINRIQPYQSTAEAVTGLRAAGIASINFDLMYGLPHQGLPEVERTAELAAGLAPDRLAVFGYAHVPWMKSHQKMIDEAALPGPVARLEQAQSVAQRLCSLGYRPIGLDHFARPEDTLSRALDEGRLRRNFQGYTADQAEVLLGFGASAIGAFPEGYVQNAVPFRAYADAIRDACLATSRGIRLDPDDRLRRAVIERLMCDMAVNLDAIGAEFGVAAKDFADELAALAPMAADGLIEIDTGRIRLTEHGRPFLRSVCAQFDRYLKRGPARHSRAV